MRIAENGNIQTFVVPIDMGTASRAGDWLSMANYDHVDIVLIADVGTASEDLVITLEQATAAAGTGNKALLFSEIFVKQGATVLTGVGTFTRVTQTAATSYTNTDNGENEQIYVIPIDASQLDVDNGYKFIQCSTSKSSGTTAGKLGTVIGIFSNSRYCGVQTPSTIA